MFDAALHLAISLDTQSNVLGEIGLQPRSYTLATIHRAENTDDPIRLDAILRGFEEFAHNIVLPLHHRTRSRIDEFGLTMSSNILVIDPVGYIDMVMLEKNAALIATDSGGVQKEAYFYSVPCVTLRDETEWVELVDAGWNCLAPPGSGSCISAIMENAYGGSGREVQLYGQGDAAGKITRKIKEGFSQ